MLYPSITETIQQIRSLESQILEGQKKYREAALLTSLTIAKIRRQQVQP